MYSNDNIVITNHGDSSHNNVDTTNNDGGKNNRNVVTPMTEGM